MEPSVRALPSSSRQAAVQSDTQWETEGQREEGVRRSTQREEEKDTIATETLTGQQSQSESVRDKLEKRKNDLTEPHRNSLERH